MTRMTKNASHLYEIEVVPEKWKKTLMTWDDEGSWVPLKRAKWAEQVHRLISIHTVFGDDASRLAGTTPEQVLAARRWAADVLARVVVEMHYLFECADTDNRSGAVDPHACPERIYEHGRYSYRRCGNCDAGAVVRPWSDGDFMEAGPVVEFFVPRSNVAYWVGVMSEAVADILEDDQRTATSSNDLVPAVEVATVHEHASAPGTMKATAITPTGETTT